MTMNPTPISDRLQPRFETTTPFLIAGLVERYECRAPAGIPNQWQRFGPFIGHMPGQVGNVAYGVSYNFDDDGNFDYMCGVEVANDSQLPKGTESQVIPSLKYVVFTHAGHVAGIRATFSAIWSTWSPESGHVAVNGPTLERYGPEFNPATGMGGLEIWIPIEG